ncbi:hypothetical protein C5F59_024545 [Streptomyces sp. QL37]|uniref:hypothetical protein n=1 Tax=Streptomyces sp. QL37 TaxID=2093747 RepID=UPI000CF1D6A2|nr:hypothetical protein [Streptomyces sp. QL37]PPQ57656.1 hypothetical protein C5F59_13870 [Streptomyces sp. QL37]
MQRGLVHAIAWSLATGAAVTLSWWGVHTVMSGTAYDPPRAVPISVGARGAQATDEPVSSSTHRALPSPSPSATASRSTAPASPRPSRKPSSRPPAASSGAAEPPASPAASGEVKSYPTRGGRVVLELADDSAKLVSATPDPGWSMQVWTNPEWIRVDFSDGAGATVSVFCTWNGHPPIVETVDQ